MLVHGGQEGLPAVVIDRYRIAQVIGNLLDNAIQHTGEGGTITVRTSAEGRDG